MNDSLEQIHLDRLENQPDRFQHLDIVLSQIINDYKGPLAFIDFSNARAIPACPPEKTTTPSKFE